MAKGQAAVDWKKPENNAKLFAAVLALIPGTPDYKKIAAVFGTNVPANAISYRLSVVRKEGKALGLHLGSGSGSTSVNTNGIAKRTKPTAKKNVAKGKGRKRGPVSDDESDDADIAVDNDNGEESAAETDDHEETPTTPKQSAKRQKTTKGHVSKRVSPRKPKKTNYVDPSDSVDNAEDEDAEDEEEDGSNVSGYEDENNVSGEPSEAGSEDSSSGTSWEGPDTSKVSYYYMGPNTSSDEEAA